jgi:hypothetical protein
MPDGRLGVLDFGAVKELPDGMPASIGSLLRVALDGDGDAVVAGLRAEGFVKDSIRIDGDELLAYLGPFMRFAEAERFRFTRDWMRDLIAHVKDPRRAEWTVGLRLNLPPEYLLIHRVWLGGVGVLCQIGGEVPVLEVFDEWLPGFERDVPRDRPDDPGDARDGAAAVTAHAPSPAPPDVAARTAASTSAP